MLARFCRFGRTTTTWSDRTVALAISRLRSSQETALPERNRTRRCASEGSRPALLLRRANKAQIEPGLSSSLDELWGSVHSAALTGPDARCSFARCAGRGQFCAIRGSGTAGASVQSPVNYAWPCLSPPITRSDKAMRLMSVLRLSASVIAELSFTDHSGTRAAEPCFADGWGRAARGSGWLRIRAPDLDPMGRNTLDAFRRGSSASRMADIAETEDADHPFVLVDNWQPANFQLFHVPHRFREILVLTATMDFRRDHIARRRRARRASKLSCPNPLHTMSRSVTIATRRSFSPMGMTHYIVVSHQFCNSVAGVSGLTQSTPLCIASLDFHGRSPPCLCLERSTIQARPLCPQLRSIQGHRVRCQFTAVCSGCSI